MPTKTNNLSFKSKLLKKITPTNSIGDALYSGIESARRAIQKPGIPFSARSHQSKHSSESKSVVVATPRQSVLPPITSEYHSWNDEYHQFRTREKLKKSMTKDPYSQKKYPYVQATASITTEEEYHPVLIPANAIHIEKPIIHEPLKQSVPGTIRYVRNKDILSSERFLPAIFTQKRPYVSQPLQMETKISLPLINNIKAPNLSTTDRLLGREELQTDSSVMHRPSRVLKLTPIYETATPLQVYG